MHTHFKILFSVLLVIYLLPGTTFVATTPIIGTAETVPNVSLGTNDQTGITSTTTANVAEVKATRTLTIGSLPVITEGPETITVGTCLVNFATSTDRGGPAVEDADCSGGATILTTTTGSSGLPRTISQMATALRTLSNVSDTGHGALTLSGSGSDVIFTTTNLETSATAITFTDGTGGNITSTASTAGVVPVAQVSTITIGGTVEAGDIFTATLPTVGAVTYTALSADTTTNQIAAGLNAAIQASSGYVGQPFTSSAGSNTILLSAKIAGTGFAVSSSAANRLGVSQVVVFTPLNVEGNFRYTITIDGTDYGYTPTGALTTQALVESLQALVDASSAVSCTENNTSITCLASSAGTPFTYSTAVAQIIISPGGASASGRVRNLVDMGNCDAAGELIRQYSSGTGGQLQYYQDNCAALPPTQPAVVGTPVVIPSAPSVVTDVPVVIPSESSVVPAVIGIERTLQFGARGNDVALLQQWLAQDTSVYPEGLVTGYFGPLTLSAVRKFQIKHGVVAKEGPGYGTVGPKTRAKLQELYGN